MALPARPRSFKADEKRDEKPGGRRRIIKSDGKFADYSSLKSSASIVIPEVKRVLLDRRKNPGTHRTNIIYPSEMARADWCPRATYYRMSGRPDPSSSPSFTLENVFAEGNAIHAKWQNWLAETGKLWGDWRCSRCAEYVKDSLKPSGTAFGSCTGTEWIDLSAYKSWNPSEFVHDWKYKEVTLSSTSHRISGHADGAMTDLDCLIEIKSIGIGTLKFEAPKLIEEHTHEIRNRNILDIEGLWKNIHRPFMAHVKQGNIYLWMAQQRQLPFDKMVFLYEFKANQQVKEFSIELCEDILHPLLDTAATIEYALIEGRPPPCPRDGCGNCRPYEKEENEVI